MSEADEASDSRTASVGKRQRVNEGFDDNIQVISSDGTLPRKRSRRDRVGHQDIRDFIPMGGSFSSNKGPLPAEHTGEVIDLTSGDDDDQDNVTNSSQLPTTNVQLATSNGLTGNWNKHNNKAQLRTSLVGTTVTSTPLDQSNNYSLASTRPMNAEPIVAPQSPIGEAASPQLPISQASDFEAISISDDSREDDGEDNDSAIMLNMRSDEEDSGGSGGDSEASEDDESEEGEIVDSDEPMQGVENDRPSQQVGLPESSDKVQQAVSPVAMRAFCKKYPSPPNRLADLNAEDLEKQLRYILFHLDREQVDLSRSVHCTACLEEGHIEDVCPDKKCDHCGDYAEHDSRFCPHWRKCLKCSEHGHDKENCPSSLWRESRTCGLCHSSAHLDDKCDMVWKPLKRKLPTGKVSIWISCSFCASKDHLLGDCPNRRTSLNSTTWTLKGFEPSQIVNLSLQKHSKKPDKPLGRPIRGRVAANRPAPRTRNGRRSPLGREFEDDDDDDDNFYRPRVNEPSPRHIRFDGRNLGGIGRAAEPGPYYTTRREDDEYSYRPEERDRDDRSYDRYDRYDNRRRSRSPDVKIRGRGHDDRWQPPLPREPPPSTLPFRGRTPHGGQARRGGGNTVPNNQPRGGGKNTGGKGKGYQPMPSAGQKAWQKLKT